MEALLVLLAALATSWLVLHVLKRRYFSSQKFLSHKTAVASVVAEHNAISGYAEDIRQRGSFTLSGSSTGAQSHLASFQNTSRHNYRRDRNVANYQSRNVHNCSLQVVRNASADPLKYVMKYFGVKSDEGHLADVEKLGEEIGRLEEAATNLKYREASIAAAIDPPAFIRAFFLREFLEHVGVVLTPITVPYPVYVFEYVSAGGNSSQRTTVTLDTPTIDALIEALSQKIRWRKSVAGQRALMTSKLRNSIKTRDKHTCKMCSVSVAAEPHLLLEVDHIVPVSKGGLSVAGNLQTLCWRCNRTKSNKMPTTRRK